MSEHEGFGVMIDGVWYPSVVGLALRLAEQDEAFAAVLDQWTVRSMERWAAFRTYWRHRLPRRVRRRERIVAMLNRVPPLKGRSGGE